MNNTIIYAGDDPALKAWVQEMAKNMAPAYYSLIYVNKCMPIEDVAIDLRPAIIDYARAQGLNVDDDGHVVEVETEG